VSLLTSGSGARKSLSRDFVLRVLTQIGMVALAIVQSAIVARWLGPEGKGLLVLLLWVPVLVVDSLGGFRDAVTWSLGKEVFERDRIISAMVGLWAMVSVSGAAIMGVAWLIQDLPLGMGALVAAICYVPAFLAMRLVNGLALGMRWMSAVNRTQLIFKVTCVIAVALALVGLGAGPDGVVWAMIFGAAAGFAYALVWARDIGRFGISLDPEVLRTLVAKGAVFSIALLLYKLNFRADMLLVEYFRDTTDVGLYSQGVGIIELVLRVPTALGAVIFSHSAAAVDAEKFRLRMRRIVTRAVPLLAIASAGLCAIAPWLIPGLYGEDFTASVPVVWALAPGMVSIGVFQLIVSDFNGRGRPEVGLYAATASLVVNLGLNFWWIPLYGTIGAGVASTVSYSVAAIILFIAQGKSAQVSDAA